MHRQEDDDVGPVLAVLVAVAHQPRGEQVTVGLVADQDVAEVSATRLMKAGKKIRQARVLPCHVAQTAS